jgi:hypothetical protein
MCPTTTAIITNNKQREQLRVDQKRKALPHTNCLKIGKSEQQKSN